MPERKRLQVEQLGHRRFGPVGQHQFDDEQSPVASHRLPARAQDPDGGLVVRIVTMLLSTYRSPPSGTA